MVGLVVAASWVCFANNFWLNILIILSGILWAFGGADGTSKAWRRIGVPTVVCLFISLNQMSWLPWIGWIPFFGVTTIGYGIPDNSDAGSPLGRFFLNIFITEEKATFMLRGFLAFLMGLSMVSVAWISFIGWVVGLILITVSVPLMVHYID